MGFGSVVLGECQGVESEVSEIQAQLEHDDNLRGVRLRTSGRYGSEEFKTKVWLVSDGI